MKSLFLIVVVLVAICAWCPWLAPEQAKQTLNTALTQMQNTEANLCPLTVDEGSFKKTFFGYKVGVSYDCSISDKTYGIAKSKDTVLITFYNGLIGMPKHYIYAPSLQ